MSSFPWRTLLAKSEDFRSVPRLAGWPRGLLRYQGCGNGRILRGGSVPRPLLPLPAVSSLTRAGDAAKTAWVCKRPDKSAPSLPSVESSDFTASRLLSQPISESGRVPFGRSLGCAHELIDDEGTTHVTPLAAFHLPGMRGDDCARLGHAQPSRRRSAVRFRPKHSIKRR